jgi:hypothetical protein
VVSITDSKFGQITKVRSAAATRSAVCTDSKISMGKAKGREYQRVLVLQEEVRRLMQSANDGAHHRAKER